MNDKEKIIAKLKEEIEYLKSLLRMHNISFEKPKEIIQFGFSDNEKIKTYISYFVGRDDIFAYEYYSKEGKRGFSPACLGRNNLTGYCPNTCSECVNKQYIGITEKEIKRHLIGNDTFGIYPLLKGDYCRLLAVDFDDEDYKESAKAFSNVCNNHHLDNLIEISSSGCGAHVWLFFDKPIKASKVRRLGTYLIYEAMDSSKGINFSSLDRMFPSQDYVPIRGYGNLIVLPLQGRKAIEGKTVFVDENFIPYDMKNQINVLASTKKVFEEEVDALLSEYKEVDFFPLLNKNVLRNIKLNRDDFSKQIILVKQNEIFVPKAALNDRSVKFIYRLASLPNPKYYEAQKNRISVYTIPRIQKLYHEDESFIYLPRGCFEDLVKVLNFFSVEIVIKDKQTLGDMIMVSFNGKLKDYQKDGLDKLLKYDNGLFVARPSYGKTVTAIALIAELKLNTLIVVPNLTLLKQWKDRLNTFLDVGYEFKKEKDKFGQYSGNKKKLTNMIDIACIDSLLSEESGEILKQYGVIIFDEVHHVGAISYEKVVRKCSSKYLYGFTATPKRRDRNEKIVYKMLGDIRYQYKEQNSLLSKILIPEFTFFTFNTIDKNGTPVKAYELESTISSPYFFYIDAQREGHRQILSLPNEYIEKSSLFLKTDNELYLIISRTLAQEIRHKQYLLKNGKLTDALCNINFNTLYDACKKYINAVSDKKQKRNSIRTITYSLLENVYKNDLHIITGYKEVKTKNSKERNCKECCCLG